MVNAAVKVMEYGVTITAFLSDKKYAYLSEIAHECRQKHTPYKKHILLSNMLRLIHNRDIIAEPIDSTLDDIGTLTTYRYSLPIEGKHD